MWRIKEWELEIWSWYSPVQPENATLFTISFQCLKKKKKRFQKLAGLWLAGEVVNHIGIYGSKAAEGLSAFQRRSCCFYPTLKKLIQPINRLKTVSKVGDLPSTIAMTAHCFGALSQVRAIGHCMIGQERDLLWPDWLNWWVCPWVPAFEIQIFLTP